MCKMKRKALFVGINEYNCEEIANLRFAVPDATSLFGMFCQLGFEAALLCDQESTTRERIYGDFKAFTDDLGPGDVLFFYFAGHGYTRGDEQVLVARNDVYGLLKHGGGVPYESLQDLVAQRGCHAVFVLDACRAEILANAPRGSGCPSRDIVPMEKLVGASRSDATLVGMRSCRKGQRSHEVQKLRHGLYTAALLDVLGDRRATGGEIVFDDALNDAVAERMATLAAENGISEKQVPEFAKSGLGRDLPCVWSQGGVAQPDAGADETVRPKATPLVSRPSADKVVPVAPKREGLYKVINLRDGSVLHLDDVPAGGWTDDCKTSKLVLRRIEPGSFSMGSPVDEEGRSSDEAVHRVTLSRPYYIGVFDVTQGQWERVMGRNPSRFGGRPLRPVEEVSWEDTGVFCRLAGHGLRLPTEAEWEYACRAGTATAFPWGNSADGSQCNCDGNYPCGRKTRGPYRRETCDVGLYAPNAWGLHDMLGNVWEWCEDWYGPYGGDGVDPTGPDSGSLHVCRGGGWSDRAGRCRSASRDRGTSGSRQGFRLCCGPNPGTGDGGFPL